MIISGDTSSGAAGHITIMPPSYSTVIQGTWAWTSNTNQWCGGYFGNTSHADGDELNYKVYVSPGTYTISLCTLKNSDHGIIKVYLDGTLILTYDCYAAVVTYNQIGSATGIIINDPGIKTLKIKIDGKNVASTDYYMTWDYIALYLTN